AAKQIEHEEAEAEEKRLFDEQMHQLNQMKELHKWMVAHHEAEKEKDTTDDDQDAAKGILADLKNPKPSSSKDSIEVSAGATKSRPVQDIHPSNHSEQIKTVPTFYKSKEKRDHSKSSQAQRLKIGSQKKGWAKTDKEGRWTESAEVECSICSEMLNNDIRQLPCKHIFHNQ
ncbi:hypothetical protein QYM36_016322, partial [Artemia franciscana]